jgi:hypothetical protein
MGIEFAYSGLPGHEGRRGLHMHTFSGKFYFPCDPRVEDVKIEDIAHHLSMQCRYAGACIDFDSVAEHSWGASYVDEEEDALEKLMHDAAEAYIQDWIRPMKYLPELMPIYLELERKNEKVIAERFQLRWPWSPAVKHADEVMVNMEMRDNLANKNKGAMHDEKEVPPHIFMRNWSPRQAKWRFLKRFDELMARRANQH